MKGITHKYNNETRIKLYRIIERMQSEVSHYISKIDHAYIDRYGYQDPELHNEKSIMVQLMRIGNKLSRKTTSILESINFDFSNLARRFSIDPDEHISSDIYISAEAILKIKKHINSCEAICQIYKDSQKGFAGTLEEECTPCEPI